MAIVIHKLPERAYAAAWPRKGPTGSLEGLASRNRLTVLNPGLIG